MKTAVYQSFRTTRVPAWITACMETVRAWAAGQGFEYGFFDDSFLELPPAWFRERCGGEICPVTDLARLLLARRLLASGYERVVWVDADMLVFDAAAMQVDTARGFAFCLELWPTVDEGNVLHCDLRVNNSICVFARENVMLDFLIDSCLQVARTQERVGKLDMSTGLLTALAHAVPLPLLRNVGMFSPVLMDDIASGRDAHLPAYAASLPMPLAAANLCHSLVGPEAAPGASAESAADAVVQRLLSTHGRVVNDYRQA